MSHSITGKLKESARSFTTKNGQGFSLRIGKPFRDHTSTESQWTNYEAVVFAKTTEQIAYYQRKLITGSVVELNAKNLKVVHSGAQNEFISIELINPTIEVIHQGEYHQSMQRTG